MSYFVDIFNSLLKYNDKTIFMVFDKEGQIWFGLKDLFRALGYTSLLHINYTEIPKNYIKKYKKIKVSQYTAIPSNMQPNMKLVNESGLYYVLSNSNKKTAKDFMNIFYTTIMPELRKTGEFIMNKTDKDKIKKLNHKLENLKNENNYLEDKHNYNTTNNGILYILKLQTSIKGVDKTVYKIGITKNIKKRLATYKTGHPNVKLLYIIKTNLDKKQLESCVKTILKFDTIKKNNEIVYTSISTLLNDINKCSKLLIDSICKCNKCKNKFGISKLSKHQCYNKLKISLQKYI
jgi:prophage antirepressor-like protein